MSDQIIQLQIRTLHGVPILGISSNDKVVFLFSNPEWEAFKASVELCWASKITDIVPPPPHGGISIFWSPAFERYCIERDQKVLVFNRKEVKLLLEQLQRAVDMAEEEE